MAASPFEYHYLEFARQTDCPKPEALLSVLYLIVGDAVRTGYQSRSLEQVEELLAKAQAHPLLDLWIQRSRNLMGKLARDV